MECAPAPMTWLYAFGLAGSGPMPRAAFVRCLAPAAGFLNGTSHRRDHGDDPRQNLTLCPSRRVSLGAQML